MIALFDPQPSFDELPARMPSPFATEPHPIARRADPRVNAYVARLMDRLDIAHASLDQSVGGAA